MAYTIRYFKQAIEDAATLQREEPKAFAKLLKLEAEQRDHPRTGTGNLNLCLEIAQVNGAAESIKNTGWSMKFMTAK